MLFDRPFIFTMSSYQKQPPEVFGKKRCSQKFRKIYQKTPVPESLFEPQPATLFEKRFCHWCFTVNFAKFLRTPVLQNTSGRLLLYQKQSPRDPAKKLQALGKIHRKTPKYLVQPVLLSSSLELHQYSQVLWVLMNVTQIQIKEKMKNC